nr:hypothetical protein [Candidatus Brachybacter algidus]
MQWHSGDRQCRGKFDINGRYNYRSGVLRRQFVDSLVITGSNPEATYTWSNDNPAIGLGASGIGNIPQFTATNSQSTPITANITVTPSGSAGGNSLVPEILYYITFNYRK